MNVIVTIQGKQAIPVRAIPLLTNWEVLTPDEVADALAGGEHGYAFHDIFAYRMEENEVRPVVQTWWENFPCRALTALSDRIKATEISHEAGYQEWRKQSLCELPAGVFVWKHEFEPRYLRRYGRQGTTFLTAAGDLMPESEQHRRVILNFDPFIAEPEIRSLVLEGFSHAASGTPFDFPLRTVDAKRWQRLGELSVEEAAFVIAGFEPPPLSVIRYQPIKYQERPGKTWALPNEYSDFVRAATSAIERGIVSARSKIQDMQTVQFVELIDVLEWAEATGFTVALKLDEPRPVRKSAPVQPVESDSTTSTAPVADSASTADEAEEQRQHRDDSPVRPIQRSAAQDAAILAAIQQTGYSPLALPANESGKRGVKAVIREALDSDALFAGTTVFNKAWERLLQREEIAYVA